MHLLLFLNHAAFEGLEAHSYQFLKVLQIIRELGQFILGTNLLNATYELISHGKQIILKEISKSNFLLENAFDLIIFAG